VRRKNLKKKKKFAINFEAGPELFNDLEQINLLIVELKKQLFKQLALKGYKPIENPKLMAFTDLNWNIEDLSTNKYQLSVKTKYVGKRKAKETLNGT